MKTKACMFKSFTTVWTWNDITSVLSIGVLLI